MNASLQIITFMMSIKELKYHLQISDEKHFFKNFILISEIKTTVNAARTNNYSEFLNLFTFCRIYTVVNEVKSSKILSNVIKSVCNIGPNDCT